MKVERRINRAELFGWEGAKMGLSKLRDIGWHSTSFQRREVVRLVSKPYRVLCAQE